MLQARISEALRAIADHVSRRFGYHPMPEATKAIDQLMTVIAAQHVSSAEADELIATRIRQGLSMELCAASPRLVQEFTRIAVSGRLDDLSARVLEAEGITFCIEERES